MVKLRGKREAPDPTRFSKKVIAAVLFSVAAFTITMIVIYVKTGGIPDTLVTAFFAFAGGEAGALGLIRYGKAKYDTSSTPTNSSDTGDNGTPAG